MVNSGLRKAAGAPSPPLAGLRFLLLPLLRFWKAPLSLLQLMERAKKPQTFPAERTGHPVPPTAPMYHFGKIFRDSPAKSAGGKQGSVVVLCSLSLPWLSYLRGKVSSAETRPGVKRLVGNGVRAVFGTHKAGGAMMAGERQGQNKRVPNKCLSSQSE